jgi:hypothetical protein
VALDDSLWHKFYTGWDWQPASGFERIPAPDSACPTVSSWGDGRLDILYVNSTGKNVLHKYYGGGRWGPSWEDVEDLGGHADAVASASWSDNRLDIVARWNGSYLHKAWTGLGWYPSEKKWESFGGNFSSKPVVVSWGVGRLDIIGISAADGSLHHKYWHEGWSHWENLGGGPFVGTPVATSWGPDRLDFWAIKEDGQLEHLYWDGYGWQGWENLGGHFTDTPKVVHWNASKIDIVGKGRGDHAFHLKSFDGSQWNPDTKGWYELAKPFSSEPSLLSKRGQSKFHSLPTVITSLTASDFLYVFGIAEDGSLRMQIWSGYDWQPGSDSTWSLGDASRPYQGGGLDNRVQEVLGPIEL